MEPTVCQAPMLHARLYRATSREIQGTFSARMCCFLTRGRQIGKSGASRHSFFDARQAGRARWAKRGRPGGFPTTRVERSSSNSLYISLKEWPRLPFTARIERPLLHRGGSASKKGTWPLLPLSSETVRCTSTGEHLVCPLMLLPHPFLPGRDDMMDGVPQTELLIHTFERGPWP